ncbi:MAG TPA: MFS transporter, partial [Steroidobacteraceae bacterium]|nr:MFS transporter [Steroidobacteraceae bacterium]
MSDAMQVSAKEHGGQWDRGSARRPGVRQILTIALLFGGYSACYFCRADLSVASPLLIEELGRRGISHSDALVHIGQIASLGVFAYAVGKLLLTGLGDFWGGRPNFLIGLGGATIFTLLFTIGGALPVFTIAWLGNRLTQSIAWAGMLKVSSKWFDFTSHGTVVGILSISYLIGDAVARQWMGALIHQGYGWRAMFYLAAGVAGFFLIANFLLLRESRTEL